MKRTIAISEDGKGYVYLSYEIGYSLTVGGGKVGQCYPCVMLVNDEDDENDNRKKVI